MRAFKDIYQILPGCYATGSIFYPDPLPPGKSPAVLYCCGHSPIGVYGYARHGVLWARRGYVCLVFDTPSSSRTIPRLYARLGCPERLIVRCQSAAHAADEVVRCSERVGGTDCVR